MTNLNRVQRRLFPDMHTWGHVGRMEVEAIIGRGKRLYLALLVATMRLIGCYYRLVGAMFLPRLLAVLRL